MTRADLTDAEHQHLFNGEHRHKVTRDGDTLTMRCACGWRLIEIPDNEFGYSQAAAEYSEHHMTVAV